jgi:oxygen-independent coproporphyrinogen-3 oxidase
MILQPENKDETACAGLYIHVPFCLRKCPYCFYSVTDLHEMEAFVDGLTKEIDLVEAYGLKFDTIYIGGGTPSLLKPSQVLKILESVRSRFVFSQNAEVTIEVNPGTISLESLKDLLNHGVNRVNMGVHLIYGLPGQSSSNWLKDLREVISYEPEHISCYMLTYEKRTPFHEWRKAGRLHPLNQDRVRGLFKDTVSFLSTNGYDQYEISNFARGQALHSRHNEKYWCHAPYVGLGPSALKAS